MILYDIIIDMLWQLRPQGFTLLPFSPNSSLFASHAWAPNGVSTGRVTRKVPDFPSVGKHWRNNYADQVQIGQDVVESVGIKGFRAPLATFFADTFRMPSLLSLVVCVLALVFILVL